MSTQMRQHIAAARDKTAVAVYPKLTTIKYKLNASIEKIPRVVGGRKNLAGPMYPA